MANSINDIAIRMGVDAAGVEAGFRQARNAAVDFTRYLQKQQDEQVRTYEESFARTALEFDAHIGAYKLMLDRQLAMQTANAAEMQRVAEEKGIYAGLFKEQAALEAQRQQEANYQALKEGYRREEVSAHANARNMEEIERLKQRNVDNARNQALAQQEADYEALKAGYRAEEAAAQANADEQARLQKQAANNFMYGVKYGDPYDNPSDRAARRAAMAARQANDQAVLKENNALQQEATALLQKHMTVSERYLAQMKRLEVLKHTYNIQTGQMMLTDDQFARMKTNLILQTIRQQQAQVRLNVAMTGGFGGMAGAAAQASYAVEDFIQVLSMGGGLNMAMMSASNNLSMVARSMFGLSSTMGLVAGSVLPLAIVGTVSLIHYLTAEKEAVVDLNDYYKQLNRETERRSQLLSQENRFYRERIDILQQSSVEQVRSADFEMHKKILELNGEQNRLLREKANLNRKNNELLINPEDSIRLQKVIDELWWKSADDAVRYKQELERILQVQQELNAAVRAGDAEKVISSAKTLNDLIGSATIASSDAAPATAERLLRMQKRAQSILTPEGEEKFREKMTGLAEDMADNEAEIAHVKQLQVDNDKLLLELQEKRSAEIRAQAIMQQEAHKMQQDEMLFMLRATDAQKELFRIQKEQQQFAGAFPGFMGGGILGGAMEAAFARQQEQDRIAFLMAQRDTLLKEQGSKLGQTPIQGSLVQNAFDAQADAFKQIFEAAAKKPDPQVEKTNELLRKIEEAIKNGGVIKVVP